ncbi:MAG: cupredoxin domain-containing protein [Pseudomonadota bacterium]
MRRILVGVFAGAALAVPGPASAATVTVGIVKSGFDPARVTITATDSVTWVNRDTVNHQVVSDTGAFASPTLRPGQRYTFTFRDSGQFRYRDALEPAERGTVIVRGLPPAVSLGVNVPILTWGLGEIKLQGTINTGRAGEPVTVFAQPYGAASPVQVAVVQTVANGAFEAQLHPTILTSYRAQYKTATSQPVSVQVRPRVTLLPGRRGWFLTRVSADHSYAGRWVYLQRKNRFGQWVSIRRYTLGRLSGKLFRVPRTGGTYRVFLTINQAGPGYLESWSGTQTVRR